MTTARLFKKRKKQQLYERVTLSRACVDDFSQRIYELFMELGLERKDALRMRLSAEETMLCWLDVLGEGSVCTLQVESRLGTSCMTLTSAGVRAAPGEMLNQEDSGREDSDPHLEAGAFKMMDALNLSFSYSYDEGVNRISFLVPKKKRRSSLCNLLIATAAALICGGVINLLPANVGSFFYEVLLTPFFNTYMDILSAMAGPMMFLTVLMGIISIGDMTTLNRIGKRLLLTYLGIQFLLVIPAVIAGLPFFGLTVNTGGDAKVLSLQVVTLILDIVPNNFLQPFLDGNSLQIVFLATILGLAILLMKRQLNFVTDFADDINSIVRLIMRTIGALAPTFIFICILEMTLSGMLGKLLGANRFILFFVIVYVLYLVTTFTILCVKMGLSPRQAAGKLINTFILALTTASSTASFGTIMDTCRKKLGIDPKLSNFGVPLGMVIFAPMLTLGFASMGLFMLKLSGIQPTMASVGALMILSVLLAVAAPPVSGGAIACFTILFAHLGIPKEHMAVAIALSTIYDYLATAGNVMGIQVVLTLIADREGLLDREVLHDKE